MQKRTFNIQWHARAGEGIITAAKMVAEIEITLDVDATINNIMAQSALLKW